MVVWAGQGTTFVRCPLEPRDNRESKWRRKGKQKKEGIGESRRKKEGKRRNTAMTVRRGHEDSKGRAVCFDGVGA